jgi:hypothetical protein
VSSGETASKTDGQRFSVGIHPMTTAATALLSAWHTLPPGSGSGFSAQLCGAGHFSLAFHQPCRQGGC